jgi:hypothetical protein
MGVIITRINIDSASVDITEYENHGSAASQAEVALYNSFIERGSLCSAENIAD